MKFFSISRKDVMELGAKVRELNDENKKLYEEVRDWRIYAHEMDNATIDAYAQINDIFQDESKDAVTREAEVLSVMSGLVAKSASSQPGGERLVARVRKRLNALFANKEIEI